MKQAHDIRLLGSELRSPGNANRPPTDGSYQPSPWWFANVRWFQQSHSFDLGRVQNRSSEWVPRVSLQASGHLPRIAHEISNPCSVLTGLRLISTGNA